MDGFNENRNLGGIRAYAGELAIRRAVWRLDETIARLGWKYEGVGHIFPVAAAKDEGVKILLHIMEYLVPIPMKHRACPEMRVEMHILKAANVASPVDQNATAQHAAVDIHDAMPPHFQWGQCGCHCSC